MRQLHTCIIIIFEPFLCFICLMSSALPKQPSSFRANWVMGASIPDFLSLEQPWEQGAAGAGSALLGSSLSARYFYNPVVTSW